MIYTYGISFNGSDYLTLTPTNYPHITTKKIENEFIWRDNVDSFKISKALNETAYNLLESWYDDETKFALDINIRIQKNAVTKWTFIFGVKMGLINYENKYYEITPEIIDQYTDLFAYKDRNSTNTNSKYYFYINEDEIDSDGVDEYYKALQYRFYDWVNAAKTALNIHTASSDYSIQSAFLWGDAYPDAGSYPSLPLLSSDFAIRQSSSGAGYISLDSLLQIPKSFQCYYHVASDYTIHFEHVGWYYSTVSDFQLDLSGEDYYDDKRVMRYSIPEFVIAEKFLFPSDEVVLSDYAIASIYYDTHYVGYTNNMREYRSDYDAYLTSDFHEKFMTIGNTELMRGWQQVTGWDNWTHSASSPNITDGDSSDSSGVAFSNYVAGAGEVVTINYDIDMTYAPSPDGLTIQGYTDNTPSATPPANLAVGNNSGSVTGNRIRIASTGTAAFTLTISLTVSNYYRIPWEAGEISDISRQNNYMSWANIINRFWTWDRFAQTGIMNGVSSDFNSSKFLKEQDAFKFYYADDLDPMRGIKTDYGTGMILTAERDLATDFVTLQLRYE